MKMFYFSTGGRYHPSPYGEWTMEFQENQLHIQRYLGDNVKYNHTFTLSTAELLTLWNKIEYLYPQLASFLPRPGVPDELQLLFRGNQPKGEWKYDVWINDARKKTDVWNFVLDLKGSIEKLTKEAVVL